MYITPRTFPNGSTTDAVVNPGRVLLAAPTPLNIARNLAGWGSMVEVLEPPAVRGELVRIGNELVGRYQPTISSADSDWPTT